MAAAMMNQAWFLFSQPAEGYATLTRRVLPRQVIGIVDLRQPGELLAGFPLQHRLHACVPPRGHRNGERAKDPD